MEYRKYQSNNNNKNNFCDIVITIVMCDIVNIKFVICDIVITIVIRDVVNNIIYRLKLQL